jgi:hypothetical protein
VSLKRSHVSISLLIPLGIAVVTELSFDFIQHRLTMSLDGPSGAMLFHVGWVVSGIIGTCSYRALQRRASLAATIAVFLGALLISFFTASLAAVARNPWEM